MHCLMLTQKRANFARVSNVKKGADERAPIRILTYSQIVNIENGRRAVGLVDFLLLAPALRMEPEELIRRLASW